MLPSNIDLTEHNDFSGGVLDLTQLMDTPVDMEYYDEKTLMTNTEYEFLTWWESIFGKRRHPSIKRQLFPQVGIDIPSLPRIIPWNNTWSPYNYNPFEEDDRIPWSSNMGEFRDDRGFNLFNRR